MKKNVIRILPFLLCLCIVLVGLPACDKHPEIEPPQKPDFAEVLTTYETASAKTGNLNAEFTLTLFQNGSPLSIVQNIDVTRTVQNGHFLLETQIGTGEIDSSISELLDGVSGFVDIGEIYDYLMGNIHGIVKIGYYNGAYNAKFDIVESEEEPDYIITDNNDRQINAFAGIAENNIEEYLTYLNYEGQELFSIKDFMMFLPIKELNWENSADEIGADLSSEDSKFHYRITVPATDVKDALFAYADKTVADFAASEEENIQEFLEEYEERKAFLRSVLTFQPLILTAQVNRNGQLETLTHDFNVTLKVSDEQILDMINDPDQRDNIEGSLLLMHAFLKIGTATNEEDKTELRFSLKTTETFVYGDDVVMDTEDDIFAGTDEEAEGRTIVGFVYNEEKGNYELERISGPDDES